eukprot:CAMPEP_0171862678 /NCGR_PEP_ID=MMETSP0992-20121227/27818_1 /TAXON_ID=483369 /ORGANISM="non described non described, Strain CCMP2098" /LENGTH=143 /DNA_ID=CAMNT_0012484931 /DNA_START=104 /DNA_END=534 /DNA_ORIENTATION=-
MSSKLDTAQIPGSRHSYLTVPDPSTTTQPPSWVSTAGCFEVSGGEGAPLLDGDADHVLKSQSGEFERPAPPPAHQWELRELVGFDTPVASKVKRVVGPPPLPLPRRQGSLDPPGAAPRVPKVAGYHVRESPRSAKPQKHRKQF